MGKKSREPAQFRAALEAASRVFAAAGLTWWIQDGTLLGAVRNGGPIPGDYDIDVGIHAADFRPSLVDDLRRAGFTLHKMRSGADDLLVSAALDGVKVDIFGWYARGSEWFYTCAHRGLKIEVAFAPFAIGAIDFLNLKVPIPSPPEQFLLAEYGETWRTPISDWHYAFSPPNLRLRGGVLTHLVYRLRYVEWRIKQFRRRMQGRVRAARPVPESGTA